MKSACVADMAQVSPQTCPAGRAEGPLRLTAGSRSTPVWPESPAQTCTPARPTSAARRIVRVADEVAPRIAALTARPVTPPIPTLGGLGFTRRRPVRVTRTVHGTRGARSRGEPWPMSLRVVKESTEKIRRVLIRRLDAMRVTPRDDRAWRERYPLPSGCQQPAAGRLIEESSRRPKPTE